MGLISGAESHRTFLHVAPPTHGGRGVPIEKGIEIMDKMDGEGQIIKPIHSTRPSGRGETGTGAD